METNSGLLDCIFDTIPILIVKKGCKDCKKAEELLVNEYIPFMKMLAGDDNDPNVPALLVDDYEFKGMSGIMKFIYGRKGWISEQSSIRSSYEEEHIRECDVSEENTRIDPV